MKHTIIERRAHPRFDLRLPLHYRVTQKGVAPYIGNGLSLDLSVGGISFRCRRPLPVGAQIELLVDWPAKYGELFPIELQVIGFVLRSAGGKTAVRMMSHRLRVSEVPCEPVRASA